MLAAALLLCASPVVTDGDSIRCADGVRLRLAGIDAPDTPAYCARKKRVCTIDQYRASKASLAAAVAGRDIEYKFVKIDVWQRTVAVAYSGGMNLSCYQLETGHAVYKEDWSGKHINCGVSKYKVEKKKNGK